MAICAAPAGTVLAQGRSGRELVVLWCTRLPKCRRSRPSVKTSSSAGPLGRLSLACVGRPNPSIRRAEVPIRQRVYGGQWQ